MEQTCPMPDLETERPAADRGGRLTRRGLFAGAAALAAVWAGRRRAEAQVGADTPGDVDPASLLHKLVSRCTFGITPEEYNLALSLGYAGYLEHHLNYAAIPENPTLAARLAALGTLDDSAATIIINGQDALARTELTEAAILRAQLSTRQLFERAVEMWTDHFNIYPDNTNLRAYKTVDDREVIRAHALGSFRSLLAASAHSPAMLAYLDNHISTAVRPNENYARELMELHTLGVTGGYTQQDVIEVARCFTGWSVRTGGPAEQRHVFLFNAVNHDNGQKTVLGNIIPAGGGQQDGETVLQILLDHPSTAAFIAGKVCRQFLGYTVPRATVDAVAAVYTQSNGDIKAMIRAALAPERLAAAAPKLKRPFHHFVSGMRGTLTTMNSSASLRNLLQGAGHLPFNWTTPDGYPDKIEHWGSNLVSRWNFGASLCSGSIANTSPDFTAMFNGLTTADQYADRINELMWAGAMPASERNRIRDYMLPDPPSAARRNEGPGLAIGAPSFQWY